MKRFFVLLFLPLFIHVHAQDRISPKELEQNERNLKTAPLLADDADFTTSFDSARWSSSSAVLLCQKTTFDFDKKGVTVGQRIGRNLVGLLLAIPTAGTSIFWENMRNEAHILVEETERRKILVKDKAALEKYSLLYFRQTTDQDAFAARVIKKDGTKQDVDLEDAVRIEDIHTVPSVFKSYTEPAPSSFYRPNYFKIAIPDLEEGDVIEYQFRHYNSKEYSSNPEYKEFDPVFYLCNRDMPVARQIIEVAAEDDHYFVTYKSMMGAPRFIETNTGGKRVYRWTDDNRDKLKDTRYVNDFREFPSIKFQVVYARSRARDLVWFKSAEDMQNDMPVKDLAEKAKAFWFQTGRISAGGDHTNLIDEIYKGLKKKGITDQSDDEYVRKAYYTIRSYTLYNSWNDYAFAKVFSGLLAKRKLDHDIIVTSYNTLCDLDKVAFTQELDWIVRYKGKYYVNPGEHGNPEDLKEYLIGNTAVSFDIRSVKEAPKTELVPLTDTADNMIYTKVGVGFDGDDQSRLAIDKTVQAKGLSKDDMEGDALALTPFMETDFRNYDGSSMWEGLNPVQADKAMTDFSQQKKDWKEDKPKQMKAQAENEYNATVEKYNDFKIQEDGRSFKKRNLQYEETFVLGGLTATAGDDILLALPALIGRQPKLTRDERLRTLPVDVSYPRTLLYSISFKVPDGYTVKGLSGITTSVDNECGSFTSTATVTDGVLRIDVRKLYKVRNLSVAQWPELCAIQDAGYAFSQRKIVLQKN
ncbi:hypothetical protein [Dinghuibacter silviterrae]|uniref:Uncharacterized protein DUF3857 n=1 Tax=Dinghuibacter silviterrae TaxID=1539049 RepID=A0A4V3GKZ8_9BACT|nr:hypothetical protein [Dinghuibacter silviterrae]TDW97602.1 uncharacterized protein DUF3857 [Dinghuibacter silviterrae]